MGWISWIVLGGIAGWLASMIMKTDKDMGIFANIIVGIIGAVIGGFVVNLIGGSDVNGFNLYSLLVALLGACILLGILKAVGRRKTV
jgi:uncharacterized membrane protein YeaQ/YmgE (transglycosylase-associated protein family)